MNAIVPTNSSVSTANSALSLAEQGRAYAASGFFADSRQAAQAITKILAARELGFGSYAGLTGIYFVKGRLSLSANLMAAAIQNSGRFRFRLKKLTNAECTVEFQEKDPDTRKWEVLGPSTFTADDAKLAGLLTGDNWKKYPRNMLYARAMSNGARWYCPLVFAGTAPYLPDELPEGADARMTEDGEYIVEAEVVSSGLQTTSTGLPLLSNDQELNDLIARTGTDIDALCKHYQVSALQKLTPEAIANAKAILKAKAQAL